MKSLAPGQNLVSQYDLEAAIIKQVHMLSVRCDQVLGTGHFSYISSQVGVCPKLLPNHDCVPLA
ncbi:hypothetical protein [Agrobacterium rosae]|uniref:hypothetical protein n=1 Tax=Agrobacterium rosae TaxID=1972867 RepID=UPI003BA2791B